MFSPHLPNSNHTLLNRYSSGLSLLSLEFRKLPHGWWVPVLHVVWFLAIPFHSFAPNGALGKRQESFQAMNSWQLWDL